MRRFHFAACPAGPIMTRMRCGLASILSCVSCDMLDSKQHPLCATLHSMESTALEAFNSCCRLSCPASLTHLQIFCFTVSLSQLSSYFRSRFRSQSIKVKMCCISLPLSAPFTPPTFTSISLDSFLSSSMCSPLSHETVGKVGELFFFF